MPTAIASLSALESRAASAAALLKALANERRLLILCKLASGERNVTALQNDLALPQSVLSQHLAILREQGLVTPRRNAQTVFYSIASPATAALITALTEIYCPEEKP